MTNNMERHDPAPGAERPAIDHENRVGGGYGRKSEVSEETRKRRAESMKAFNRKTGKITKMANGRVRTLRRGT